jgi:hypothetical protein
MYLDFLENGSPLAVKAASFAVAALLVLIVAVPTLVVAAQII